MLRSGLTTRFTTFLFLAVLAGAAHTTWAQQANTAVVVGTVLDSSEGAVPGATIALTHLDTNTTSTVVSDEKGQYRTGPLRIGEYTVTVELPGFKTFVQRGVVLNIGDVRKVDARLQLGDVAEQITVAAAVPLLSTVDSTVGTVITNRQIKDLPLNGRDYLQLASLSSGTLPTLITALISVRHPVILWFDWMSASSPIPDARLFFLNQDLRRVGMYRERI